MRPESLVWSLVGLDLVERGSQGASTWDRGPVQPQADQERLRLSWGWLALTTTSVIRFLGLDALIWSYTTWESAGSDAGSIGAALVLLPLLGLLVATWAFADARRRWTFRDVGLRLATVILAFSVADAVYDQGSWLSDPASSFLINLMWSGAGYLITIGAGAALGCGIGRDVHDSRARRDGVSSTVPST